MPLSGKVSGSPLRRRLAYSPPAELAPNIIFGKVGGMNPPPKVPNADRRSREYLTAAEIDRLIAAAQRLGRHGQRDATMVLLAYRHGLRVSELVELRREQVDLRQGLLHVRRRKNGLPSTHPLRGPELRALNKVGDGNDSFRRFTHRLRPAWFPLAGPTAGIAGPHLVAFSSSRRPDSLSVPSAWR